MGKIDDMRREREQQFADKAKRQAKTTTVVVASAAPVASAEVEALPSSPSPAPKPTRQQKPTKPTKPAATTDDDRGKCPECGKMKPLSNGVLANHQKGFGKACAGSRKKPA